MPKNLIAWSVGGEIAMRAPKFELPAICAAAIRSEPHRASRVCRWSCRQAVWCGLVLAVLLPLSGCTSPLEYIRNGFKVGPNYVEPPGVVAQEWIDAAKEADAGRRRGLVRLQTTEDDLSNWWTHFKVPNDQGQEVPDPVLHALACVAYQQNLTLRQAGFRILQARAEQAIAVGSFFPQTQQAFGDYIREATSKETAGKSLSTGKRFFSSWDFGFNLAWELDFWGRFRRAIEAADAALDASVYDYDAVLVTLLGDVASNYVEMRTLQRRIELARANVEQQQRVFDIAVAQVGISGKINEEHTRSILAQTESLIPQLEIGLRLVNNRLCILLGIPPEDLQRRLGVAAIPTAPPAVVAGIPADLLRRRPDVRRAERLAAAQSAQIGIAESDFYPRVSITGTLGYSAAEFKNLFRSAAFNGNVGPSFKWDLLNYGRILNHVRAEDALFQQAALAYQNTVLTANQEVENGFVAFLRSHEEVYYLTKSADAAAKAFKGADDRYKAGLGGLKAGETDFTQGLVLLQQKVQEEDALAQAQGNVALGLIQVYRALGGGWQIRLTGCDPEHAPPGRLGPPQEVLPAPRGGPARRPDAAPDMTPGTPVGIRARLGFH
jgi:NodT family efflux transporter outer membrane factor (OMF) lipoprotein